jgi:hypothetical protein
MSAVEEPAARAGRTTNGSAQSSVAGKSPNGSTTGRTHSTSSESALLGVRHARTTNQGQADTQTKYDDHLPHGMLLLFPVVIVCRATFPLKT